MEYERSEPDFKKPREQCGEKVDQAAESENKLAWLTLAADWQYLAEGDAINSLLVWSHREHRRT